MLSSRGKLLSVVGPVADAFAGTINSDAINMKGWSKCTFVVQKGVGLTGTSTVTVEKCTLANGTGAEAIPFYYRRISNAAGEVQSDITHAEAAGFTTTAGSEEMYEVYVTDQHEGLAEGDKPFIRLHAVEVVDSPVAGAILAYLEGNRFATDTVALA